MRTGATLLLVVALATPIRSDDAKDRDRLQGTWKLVEYTRAGKSGEFDYTAVIRGDKIEFISGDKKNLNSEYRMVLDSTVTPKEIDFHALDKGKLGDKMAKGLYEIDGDRLRLCFKLFQFQPPWSRPTAFQSTEEGNEILVVLRREPTAK